jgi:hypothetical protein
MTRPFQCTLLNTTYNTLIGGSYFFNITYDVSGTVYTYIVEPTPGSL